MQRNYDMYMPEAAPGLLSGMGNSRILPFINGVGLVYDQYSLTIPATPTSSTVYSVTVDGITTSFTTDASATNAELEDGLLNSMRTNPEFNSRVEATLDAVANTITLTARQYLQPLAVSAPQFTVTRITASLPKISPIPFGRYIARKSTYVQDVAALPTATTDKLVGITLSNHGTEKTGMYDEAIAGYPAMSTMNAVDRTNDRKGIWVECVEANLTPDDTVYVAVTAGNEGKVTRVTSGTIATVNARIMAKTVVCNGKNLVLVSHNMP